MYAVVLVVGPKVEAGETASTIPYLQKRGNGIHFCRVGYTVTSVGATLVEKKLVRMVATENVVLAEIVLAVTFIPVVRTDSHRHPIFFAS